ncbi:hypothetical protein RFI_37989 [Reticulomyxa filosa]|uniref:Uncharacterized protein n=1 Tax=Reticulomyxa filosa TaxID=46433 RepID=X6LBV3_RETFI|nr:hypothetical protein RFI_37989 [Reticulomyxa filosa]|eukprot:ETN99482.1 hypothetical protein RFI_37989 [Reticulomyxa filosa]
MHSGIGVGNGIGHEEKKIEEVTFENVWKKNMKVRRQLYTKKILSKKFFFTSQISDIAILREIRYTQDNKRNIQLNSRHKIIARKNIEQKLFVKTINKNLEKLLEEKNLFAFYKIIYKKRLPQ